jgi:hypothetical protein
MQLKFILALFYMKSDLYMRSYAQFERELHCINCHTNVATSIRTHGIKVMPAEIDRMSKQVNVICFKLLTQIFPQGMGRRNRNVRMVHTSD